MEKKRLYLTSNPEEIRQHLEKLYAKISDQVKIHDSVKKQKRNISVAKKISPFVLMVPSINPVKWVFNDMCSNIFLIVGLSKDSFKAPTNQTAKLNIIETINAMSPLSVKLEASKSIAA